jgi:hypothetical protein
MKKIDFKRDLKKLYGTDAKNVAMVDVPPMCFLMIDGEGDPNAAPAFQEAVEALFSVSYTVKFMVKKGPQEIDYGVMPLEGLWWADDMATFTGGDKSKWKWTLMILQPDFATDDILRAAIDDVRKKKALPGVERLRVETFAEGPAAQVLHVGSFKDEGPTILRLHDFITAEHRERNGKHHEIYLSDFRRAAPEKWKTLLRQPIK